MITRECVICAAPIRNRRADAVLCGSEECRKEQSRRRTRAWKRGESFPRYRLTPLTKEQLNKRGKLKMYGLPQDIREALAEQPEGTCNICGETAKLTIDHDHRCCPGRRSCGACVRGFLCPRCNATAAALRDNPELLQRMIAYLDEFENMITPNVTLLRGR